MVLLGNIFGILIVIAGIVYIVKLFAYVIKLDLDKPIIIERTISFEPKDGSKENKSRDGDHKPD